MKIEKRNFSLILDNTINANEMTGGDQRKAKGYAAVFNSDSEDLGGFVERILPGAFTRSLAMASNGQRNIFALWAHDDAQPLGSTNSKRLILAEDERGLAFEMDTTRMTAAQLSALEDGDLRMSFGFSVRDQNWKELDDGSVERTLIDVELYEVSFVICPAYPDTSAALRCLEEWKEERASIVAADLHEAEPADAATGDATGADPTNGRGERLKRVLTAMLDSRLRK